MPQGSKVGGTSGSGRGGDWSPGSQLAPVLPDSPSSSHWGREVRGDSFVYRALLGNPLGPDEATEAQSSDGQESGVGWGLSRQSEAAEGQRAATEHGREMVGAPRHLSSPRSLQEPPDPSPCLPSAPLSVFWAPARAVLLNLKADSSNSVRSNSPWLPPPGEESEFARVGRALHANLNSLSDPSQSLR